MHDSIIICVLAVTTLLNTFHSLALISFLSVPVYLRLGNEMYSCDSTYLKIKHLYRQRHILLSVSCVLECFMFKKIKYKTVYSRRVSCKPRQERWVGLLFSSSWVFSSSSCFLWRLTNNILMLCAANWSGLEQEPERNQILSFEMSLFELFYVN